MYLQKDETFVSKIKISRHNKSKRVRKGGSTVYHVLVNCHRIVDTEGSIHQPMLDIFVRGLPQRDGQTMLQDVEHLAKNKRTIVSNDAHRASFVVGRKFQKDGAGAHYGQKYENLSFRFNIFGIEYIYIIEY